MKKRILILISLLLAIIGVIIIYIGTLAPIITGYAAKNLASGVFVAGRSQESLEKEDLNFSFIKFNKNKIDYEKKEVISRFLFWRSKAIYIDQFGCCLVRNFSEEEIKSRPYNTIPFPDINTDTIAWPIGDKITDTIPPGINIQKLDSYLEQVFADSLPLKGTFAVTVAYKNQLVTERYRNDLSADNLFLSWSMAKSIVNTLIGILISQEKTDLQQTISTLVQKDNSYRDITLADLLHMNSGLEWNKDYGNDSDVNKMLFKNSDMAQFASQKQRTLPPDSIWYYSSGSTNIVCKFIRDIIRNDAEYYRFPRQELFNKIGMKSAVFEVDASGTFIGSSYLYATMRDYTRYGLLYLNEGKWNGNQLLTKEWIDFTTTPARGSNGEYGAFFWLNNKQDYPGVPADMYSCRGHDGQYIFIIPSKQLVVVRTGFSQKGVFDPNIFLKGILECIED